ncbi:TetR/AcrR family transcriptional regulator [Vibrio rhizosphaerae]|uniref:TetR/AcrR family transcriptional regulator n=1 Tax=Vibrio rhizosphaerae TaxID=398736 RepID=A0ABU4IY87_9VIBR|nr:TetR/AcrR family transcriptional regulator [Vibrio rhizosphaerae]MDW6094365.1 TetR/AcrR family transcriptional regulator [Vibrio rhizosphaerae]
MPKRSREETEVTIQTILDAVVYQVLNLGYDRMSYTTLSQQTGISRTGISHHFPKKTDFATALNSQIFLLFTSYLELENGVAAFRRSWMQALEHSQFVAILRFLFHHIISAERSVDVSRQGLERMYHLIEEKLGTDADKELEWLLGKSLVAMSNHEILEPEAV